MAASQSSVSFSIVNPKNSNTVYVGQDNTVTVQAVNQTGATITLPGGTPADPVTGSGFTLLLFFNALFANEESAPCGDLSVTATGWTAKFFADAPYPGWAISPNDNTDWDAGASLNVTVAGLTPTTAVSLCQVAMDIYNLPGAENFSVTCPVNVANPAGGLNITDAVGISLSLPGTTNDATIGISRDPQYPIQNSLELILSNKTQQPLVPDGVDWGVDPPSVNITFVYGSAPPGYFALTTPDDGSQISVGLGTGNTLWTATQLAGSAGPVWSLQPIAGTNNQILGTGVQAVATFELTNIVTEFAATPTLAYIQFVNIPGYADGSTTLVLDKVYETMTISGPLALSTDTVTVSADSGPQTVSLNWTVENATMVEVSGLGMVPPSGQNVQVPVWRTTSFVLTAYDTYLNAIATSQATVTAQAPQSASALLGQLLPLGAVVPWSGSLDSVPAGYAVCDGSSLSVADNPQLYFVIGKTFGGDGITTFCLPDLQDRFVIGTASGSVAVGDTGSPTHTHTMSQMPSAAANTTSDGAHTHGVPSDWYAVMCTTGSYRASIDTGGTLGDPNMPEPNNIFQSNGTHSHGVTLDYSQAAVTAPQSGGMRPTWFSLCYIIRTGV
ncbi:phage tail protein [Mesorhizobium sp.]|uniref:phage tail protein n=1 Tax=Mesorhizobium sp. TaxID=1871066 RepID=UPI000FE655AD|nr:phage tail protein [Mesorhizobium sp.]RWA84406.1 MAG: tail fiber protein [Mesorhizobium sp.]